jgi:acyl-CoA thioester hydrolase
VGCTLKERSRASLTFRQAVTREGTDDLLVDGEVRIACLDANKLKPRGLPDVVLQSLAQMSVLPQVGGGNR